MKDHATCGIQKYYCEKVGVKRKKFERDTEQNKKMRQRYSNE